MLWLPSAGQVRTISNAGIVGAFPGSAITAGAADTYGSIVELISAANNDQDSWGISFTILSTTSPGALATQACMDILIGGATDDVLVSSLICGGAMRAPAINYFFPVHIPQGKRIAAQVSCATASRVFHCAVTLFGGGVPSFRTGRKITTLGTKVNNSRGVTCTTATSGGAAVATQIIASTAEDYFAVLPGFQTETDTSMATEQMNIGIGIGAATEERIGTWNWAHSSTEENFGPSPPIPAFKSVPSGSRLTLLASSAGSAETAYGGLIYAVS